MTDRAAKAERSLAKTCSKLGITETGKRWLDLCLDPFKDINMPTAGYPDSVTIPSVVQTIHDSFSIAVPASVAPGANWDANIFIDQLYNAVQLYQTTFDASQSNMYQGTQAATPYQRGGLCVRSGPAGVALGTTSTTFASSFKQDVLAEGDVRLIGVGLEIHNTTGELYKQGALICYRIPDAPIQNLVVNQCVDNGATACIPLTEKAVELIEVPVTGSQAIDLPGSVQWEAKDGAYVVPVLSAPTNFPTTPEVVAPIEVDEVSAAYYYPKLSLSGAAKMVYLPNDTRNIIHSFSPTGVFLTGLSYQTTLQANLTYYVEVFPKKSSVLRRSVQPAPGLDAKALDLYAHIVAHMPVGVEVNDNFIGAFISGIANIARTVIPAIVRGAPMVLRGISTAGQIADLLTPMGGRNNALSNLSGSNRFSNREEEIIEEVNSPAIIRENQRAIVQSAPVNPRGGVIISDTLSRRGNETITQVNRNGVTRTTFQPNVHRNNGTQSVRTQKARTKKNNIIDQATKGYAGNRWINNKK
jgi:hypothetical protein